MPKTTITPALATAEINRRALPKTDPARADYPADEIMRLSGPALAAIAAKAKRTTKRTAKTPETTPETTPEKALAKRAGERAAASAPDGHRVAAKIRAHRAVLDGMTLTEALDAARETVRLRTTKTEEN
jgi:acetylornithine deacetylase/succinyl-diaminopimelate desuccinylase-like protein